MSNFHATFQIKFTDLIYIIFRHQNHSKMSEKEQFLEFCNHVHGMVTHGATHFFLGPVTCDKIFKLTFGCCLTGASCGTAAATRSTAYIGQQRGDVHASKALGKKTGPERLHGNTGCLGEGLDLVGLK